MKDLKNKTKSKLTQANDLQENHYKGKYKLTTYHDLNEGFFGKVLSFFSGGGPTDPEAIKKAVKGLEYLKSNCKSVVRLLGDVAEYKGDKDAKFSKDSSSQEVRKFLDDVLGPNMLKQMDIEMNDAEEGLSLVAVMGNTGGRTMPFLSDINPSADGIIKAYMFGSGIDAGGKRGDKFFSRLERKARFKMGKSGYYNANTRTVITLLQGVKSFVSEQPGKLKEMGGDDGILGNELDNLQKRIAAAVSITSYFAKLPDDRFIELISDGTKEEDLSSKQKSEISNLKRVRSKISAIG